MFNSILCVRLFIYLQFFNDTATTEIYTLSLHDALPISVPDGIVGGTYNQQLNASGGQWPYSWSLTPGSLALPGGMNLSSGGIISGMPTNAPFGGTDYYFSVRVRDNVANTVDQLL